MASYDHIIIGSGINGLVAAAMLAGKGQRVLVLERSDILGGCMRTDEATLPGFQHDVMAATFSHRDDSICTMSSAAPPM
ncbi:MAG: NAD(P)-binding protein [Chloroflexi bacterium]|nr:NAD(P)-binding protein [Chloroflexota bacterium]